MVQGSEARQLFGNPVKSNVGDDNSPGYDQRGTRGTGPRALAEQKNKVRFFDFLMPVNIPKCRAMYPKYVPWDPMLSVIRDCGQRNQVGVGGDTLNKENRFLHCTTSQSLNKLVAYFDFL